MERIIDEIVIEAYVNRAAPTDDLFAKLTRSANVARATAGLSDGTVRNLANVAARRLEKI